MNIKLKIKKTLLILYKSVNKGIVHKLFLKYANYKLTKTGIYNGHKYIKLLNINDANNLIIEKLNSDKAFMISRYGAVEFRTLVTGKGLDALCNNAGFFPNDKKLIKKFQEEYLEASKQIDILGMITYKYAGVMHWFRKLKLIRSLPNIENLIVFHTLNPYDNRWIKALDNKKVLVVHPFKKSIEKQYKRRDKINSIPKFKTLEVIQAVQTIAGTKDHRFKTWFEALDYMKDEISKKEFDVCLIGCGAYGLPLAAHVKKMGKQAIHIGGALQLLFAIKGRRWETEYNFKFNDYWIRPVDEDRPKNADRVENACYW